jgi:uncharacterized protein YkwD
LTRRFITCCLLLAVLSWPAATAARHRRSAEVDPPRRAHGLEAQILATINFAREHPAEYARQLRRGPMTDATREAIEYLDDRRSAQPFRMTSGLAVSAAIHAADQGRRGSFEHRGSDGSSAGERMRRQGVWAGIMAEEMSAGEYTAADVVRQLIVDEGVPDRGHRIDLMDPHLTRAGVGCAPHRVYGVICVIDLASRSPI